MLESVHTYAMSVISQPHQAGAERAAEQVRATLSSSWLQPRAAHIGGSTSANVGSVSECSRISELRQWPTESRWKKKKSHVPIIRETASFYLSEMTARLNLSGH